MQLPDDLLLPDLLGVHGDIGMRHPGAHSHEYDEEGPVEGFASSTEQDRRHEVWSYEHLLRPMVTAAELDITEVGDTCWAWEMS
jgi:hypothetical protein